MPKAVLSLQGRPAASEELAWEAAVRGPLLVSILDAYRAVSPDAWRAKLTCVPTATSRMHCLCTCSCWVHLSAAAARCSAWMCCRRTVSKIEDRGSNPNQPQQWLQVVFLQCRRLYPHLAKLVCSGQPGVRTALGDLMRQQLPSVIAGAA